jgi:hypothetical protein
MANGLLGKSLTTVDSDVTVYTAPSSIQYATVNVAATNIGAEIAKLRIAVTLSASPGNADWVEFDAEIPANGGVLERTCLILSPNEKIIVRCNKATVAVRVNGLEAV